jgi:hypothetical protein
MKITRIPVASIILFVLAFLIALHQYIFWHVWFELKDVHHELFIAGCFFAGLVLLLYANARRKKVIKVGR